MFAEFKHTLRRQRGSIIGWGVSLFLYSLMMVSFYSSIDNIFGDITMLLESYPKEMLAFFPNIAQIGSPAGYMDTYFFSLMHLIIGIYAISTFAGMLSKQEEDGILDLLLAQPVSRGGVFWGRVLGITASIIMILLLSWLGWVIPAKNAGLELSWLEFLAPYLPLLCILLLFGALALLFSMLLPASRLAGGLTGALLVGNFLMVGLSNLNSDLKSIFELTPFYFYQGGDAVNGINWGWNLGLLAVALLIMALAWVIFRRRDIRVGGERTFHLSDLLPSRKSA